MTKNTPQYAIPTMMILFALGNIGNTRTAGFNPIEGAIDFSEDIISKDRIKKWGPSLIVRSINENWRGEPLVRDFTTAIFPSLYTKAGWRGYYNNKKNGSYTLSTEDVARLMFSKKGTNWESMGIPLEDTRGFSQKIYENI
jgi:hypothetical protein